jgi:four helix bundle protein
MRPIAKHWELDVYKMAFDAAMQIFETSKGFPKAETYSLIDQIRRSSRSAATAIAEGWRRRKYEPAFVNKLNEAEAEAAETQVWLQFAAKCGYLTSGQGRVLHKVYDQLIGKLVNMGNDPRPWILKKTTTVNRRVSPAPLPTRSPAPSLPARLPATDS